MANEPLVVDGKGNALSLVVAIDRRRALLVFDRRRQEWELPGGMIEPGESPRDAAVREYVEETGQPVPDLRFAGLATFRLMPDRRIEHAAVYRSEVTPATGFRANEEIADICWWDDAPLPGLAVLDAEICRLAREPETPEESLH